MWQVGLAFGRLVGLLCGHVVAPSGTLLVAYQICAAEHDFISSSGDTYIFPKLVYSLSTLPSLVNSWYVV